MTVSHRPSFAARDARPDDRLQLLTLSRLLTGCLEPASHTSAVGHRWPTTVLLIDLSYDWWSRTLAEPLPRYIVEPIAPKPRSIMVQVAGSGTALELAASCCAMTV